MLVSPRVRLSNYQHGFAPVVFCLLILVGLTGVVVGQGSGTSSGATGGGNRTNTGANSIRGKVYLPSGVMPEHRMHVLLEISTGGVAAETFTDSVGNYEFRSVTNSTYRVTVPSDQRPFETAKVVVENYGNTHLKLRLYSKT
jgi:hypothetical protein